MINLLTHKYHTNSDKHWTDHPTLYNYRISNHDLLLTKSKSGHWNWNQRETSINFRQNYGSSIINDNPPAEKQNEDDFFKLISEN